MKSILSLAFASVLFFAINSSAENKAPAVVSDPVTGAGKAVQAANGAAAAVVDKAKAAENVAKDLKADAKAVGTPVGDDEEEMGDEGEEEEVEDEVAE